MKGDRERERERKREGDRVNLIRLQQHLSQQPFLEIQKLRAENGVAAGISVSIGPALASDLR